MDIKEQNNIIEDVREEIFDQKTMIKVNKFIKMQYIK